jgi:hypothetical protein
MTPQQDETQPDETAEAAEAAETAGKPWPKPRSRHDRRHGAWAPGTPTRGRGARRRAFPLPLHPALGDRFGLRPLR